jgi:catechol 2,3-dioxygenase-like lactoylglutathione lyase family enzyme
MKPAVTLYVTALEPMVAFYAEGLGFEVVDDVPEEYRVLESASWVLSIVLVPPFVAEALSFDVPSITGARARIVELGGRVEGELWEFRGFRHRDVVDPEGNVGLLREAVDPG